MTRPRSVSPQSRAPHPSRPALAVGSRSGIGIHQGEGPPLLSKHITDHPCPTPAVLLPPLARPTLGRLSPPELHVLGLLPSHVTTRVPSLTIPPKGTCLPTPSLLTFHPNCEPQAACLPRRGTSSYASDASMSFAGCLLYAKAARPCRHTHQTTRSF